MRTFVLFLLGASLAVGSAHAADLLTPAELLERRSPANPRPLPFGEQAPRFRGVSVPWPVHCDSVIRNDFVCNDDVTGGCRELHANMRD